MTEMNFFLELRLPRRFCTSVALVPILYLCPEAIIKTTATGRPAGSQDPNATMRKFVFICLAATASAFSTGSLLVSTTPRLRRATGVTSLRARDCIFDSEPCESSGECRVNNAFCDDNHGVHQPGPRQPCARKAVPKARPETLLKVEKIFDEVRAEQKKVGQSTK